MKKHNDIQQGTEEWHQMRKGKITGTTLKAIMGTPKARQEAKYEIIAERLTIGVDMDYENPMDRGHRLESEALAAFEFETGKKIETTGYIEQDDNSLIGYSPDAIVSDTNDAEDVEVKCPLGKNYVKMWLTDEVPEEYYWQMIQGFAVNPILTKRYFVGYNPDITVHPLHIIEVNRSEVENSISVALEKQNAFLLEVESELAKIITL